MGQRGSVPANGELRDEVPQVRRRHPAGRTHPLVQHGSASETPEVPHARNIERRSTQGADVDPGLPDAGGFGSTFTRQRCLRAG